MNVPDLISDGAVAIVARGDLPTYRVVIRPANLWLSQTPGYWVTLQTIGNIFTDAPGVGWTGTGLQPGDGITTAPLWFCKLRARALLRRAKRADR